jgi:ketosteroid isomerase-like protein
MAGGKMMPRQLVLISLLALITATAAGQNTNSSTNSTTRSAGTNTNRPASSPKPTDTQKPAVTPKAAPTIPPKPKVVPTPAPGPDTVPAAFERLLSGIRKADVKAVSGVYLNSPNLVLFNNNGTMTRGWEQMRKNRESSYPDIKDVKLDVRDLAVTMLGRDGAVVTCQWTQSQTYKDVPETATGRMTLVFKRVGKEWKAVHLHTSPDKPDPSRVMPSEETPSPTPAATPSPSPNQ